MTTNVSQSIIYTSNPTNQLSYSTASVNASGLGTSQCLTFTSPSVLTAGSTVACLIQAPKPAPLFYIGSNAATTTLQIFTPLQTPITLTAFSSVGFFNQGYFQPNPGQKFIFFIKVGAVTTVGQVLLTLQTVVENTLSQYVDMGSIKFEHSGRCRVPPVVRQIVTGNTTSAVPNTFAFDFVDYPLTEQENAIVKFKSMLNAQAMYTFGALGGMAPNSTSTPYVLIGGQWGSIIYAGGRGSTYTGTIFLLIVNIGNLSLPDTTYATSLPTIFDESDFSGLVGSVGSDSTYAGIAEIKEMLQGKRPKSFGAIGFNEDSDSDDDEVLKGIEVVRTHVERLDIAPMKMIMDKLLNVSQNVQSKLDALTRNTKSEHDRMLELLHSHSLSISMMGNAMGLNEEKSVE